MSVKGDRVECSINGTVVGELPEGRCSWPPAS